MEKYEIVVEVEAEDQDAAKEKLEAYLPDSGWCFVKALSK